MDAVETIVAALSGSLECRVVTDVPAERPATFVDVSRVGGTTGLFLDRPLVACTAWAGSDADAYALAESVADAMLALPDTEPNVGGVEANAFYRSDLDGRHRYTATFDVLVNR